MSLQKKNAAKNETGRLAASRYNAGQGCVRRLNMRSRVRIISIAARLSLLLLLVLTSAALKETIPGESLQDLWVRYNAAVVDSATYRHENLRRLFPLRYDPTTMTTKVVTLTGYDYKVEQQTLSRYIWVTEVPEVRDKVPEVCERRSGTQPA